MLDLEKRILAVLSQADSWVNLMVLGDEKLGVNSLEKGFTIIFKCDTILNEEPMLRRRHGVIC